MNPRGLFASLFRQKQKVNPDSPDPIYDSLVRLFASDKFPWRMENFPERVEMNWSNGFKVIARNNRWPLVIVESNGLKFTYENDRLLVDAAVKFADRADAARDRTRVVAAIQEILQ